MKRSISHITILLLIILLERSYAQSDSIFIYNNQIQTQMKVSLSDYLSKTEKYFNDSLKYNIRNYFKDQSDSIANNLIADNYFVALDYYDYHEHPIVFDKILMELLNEDKLTFIKNGVTYQKNETSTDIQKVYRCGDHGIYIGKNYIIKKGDLVLGSFIKFRNSNTYRLISCF